MSRSVKSMSRVVDANSRVRERHAYGQLAVTREDKGR